MYFVVLFSVDVLWFTDQNIDHITFRNIVFQPITLKLPFEIEKLISEFILGNSNNLVATKQMWKQFIISKQITTPLDSRIQLRMDYIIMERMKKAFQMIENENKCNNNSNFLHCANISFASNHINVTNLWLHLNNPDLLQLIEYPVKLQQLTLSIRNRDIKSFHKSKNEKQLCLSDIPLPNHYLNCLKYLHLEGDFIIDQSLPLVTTFIHVKTLMLHNINPGIQNLSLFNDYPPYLENLYLANCGIIEIGDLNYLPLTIKRVDICDQSIDIIQGDIGGQLINLKDLRIENNHPSLELRNVSFPPSLKVLYLRENEIKMIDFEQIQWIPDTLETLNLEGNQNVHVAQDWLHHYSLQPNSKHGEIFQSSFCDGKWFGLF